jgi:hypothetical protein
MVLPTGHPRGLVPFIKLIYNGYCSSNAFLLGVSSLTEAQRCGLIAGSKSHMLDGEFAKLVNDTTGLHLMRYVLNS